jgi:hypothetical protein
MLDGASTEGKRVMSSVWALERGCRGGGPRRSEGGCREAGGEEKSRGDDEDSRAQPEEGTREGEWCSRHSDGKWSVSGLVLALSRNEKNT